MHIVTHDGTFHADEVLAIVLLQAFFHDEEFHVVRTRDEETLAKLKSVQTQ